MEIDERTKFMIMLGAARAVKCGPCMEQALAWCKEAGISGEDMAQALAVGQMVRDGSQKMLTRQAEDQLAETLEALGVTLDVPWDVGCTCPAG